MRVDIWSDVVCPWCYIGKRNLERALDGFEQAAAVEIHWHAYELDPNAPREREGTYVERLAHKYRVDVEHAQGMIDRIVAAGAEAGLDFHFERSRPGNTFDAHRLLRLAAEHGPALQGSLKERLLRAAHVEGEPVGNAEALARLAVEAGLSAAEVRDVLDGDKFGAEVRAEERTAHELDVTGVPFFIFDRTWAVPGAQPPEVFARVLERAWAQRAGQVGPDDLERPANAEPAGDVCEVSGDGPGDACAV